MLSGLTPEALRIRTLGERTVESPLVRAGGSTGFGPDEAGIHKLGGTILGSSREKVDREVAVSFLQRLGVNLLFAIGGDGTLKGAHLIQKEADRRGYKLAVIGVPKTIDNDIPFVWRSFGY